ncbi:MAG: M42 family peptidase, partial [Oscillospiraceae bacterium]
HVLLNDLISSKSLDDRAGCAAVIYAGYLIKKQNPNIGVTLCLSTMEEVGGQGAKTAAFDINPTHAIAVDVSFAHTPDAKVEKCGKLFGGPMVGVSPILNKEMSEKLMEIAKAENIPYQIEAMGGKTSTNADEIAITRGGVITGLLSIPQRYMHTPIETASLSDIENTGKLMAEYVKTICD